MVDVTILVKTFMRPQTLRECVDSIRKFYPNVPIMVADDSKEPKPLKRKNLTYYTLPFDVGLSYGRNFLVSKVKTKYVVLIDDDSIFTAQSKLEKFKRALDKYPELDLVAGAVKTDNQVVHYEGLLSLRNHVLRYKPGSLGRLGEVVLYDLVLNFFMARTKSLRKFKWDEELKVGGEHTEWMLRTKGKLTKGYLPDVVVINSQHRTEDYTAYRQRKEFFTLFMRKYQIERVINFSGQEKRVDLKNPPIVQVKMPKPKIFLRQLKSVKVPNGVDVLHKNKIVGRVRGKYTDDDIKRKKGYILKELNA